MVEEGVRGKLSSSSEIHFSAEPLQHTQTPRMPTLNVTHTNIESHAKTEQTAPKTPYRDPNSPKNANKKV